MPALRPARRPPPAPLALAAAAALALAGCGAAAAPAKLAATPAAAAGGAAGPAGAAALPDEKLVITGSMSLEVDHGPAAVDAIRADVEAVGGRIVHEDQSGRDDRWTAHLQVRLPPGDVGAFADRVAAIGRVLSRRIQASDVSREYFDQELAIANLRLTLDRLQALLANPDLKTAEILEIERELTRVRGELERLEGAHRFLSDRIAYATLDLHLSGHGTHLLAPQAAVWPGVRVTTLYLVDAPDGADRVRTGVGATLWFHRASSLELDVYPAGDGGGRVVVATLGGAGYSAFLGAGRRTWLNPYLGARSGYAWVGRSAFVAAGEVGVEVVKTERLVVEAAGRGLGLFHGDGVEAALQVTAGVRVAF